MDFLDEYSKWIDTLKSPEWGHLQSIYDNHKDYCLKEARRTLITKKYDEAYSWQMRAEDVDRIRTLIEDRIKELRSKLGKEV